MSPFGALPGSEGSTLDLVHLFGGTADVIVLDEPAFGRLVRDVPAEIHLDFFHLCLTQRDGFRVAELPAIFHGQLVRHEASILGPGGRLQHLVLGAPDPGEGRVASKWPGVHATGDAEKDGNGPDGMTFDERGNLYATYKTVVVLDPSRQVVARVEIPEKPTNCTA